MKPFIRYQLHLLCHINTNLADINECQDGNIGGCTDQCTNTRGSYQCSCRRGYEFRREDEAPGSGEPGSGTGGADMTVYPITDAGRPCQGFISFFIQFQISQLIHTCSLQQWHSQAPAHPGTCPSNFACALVFTCRSSKLASHTKESAFIHHIHMYSIRC